MAGDYDYVNVTGTTAGSGNLLWANSSGGKSFIVNTFPVQAVATDPPKAQTALEWLRGQVDAMCQYAFAN